jgi:hypothetical protein
VALSFGPGGGLKMNWVDTAAEAEGLVIKARPMNMQGINLSGGRETHEFDQLHPALKVAVQRAQKGLWDEAALFRDGKRRPPNVVGLFRSDYSRAGRNGNPRSKRGTLATWPLVSSSPAR